MGNRRKYILGRAGLKHFLPSARAPRAPDFPCSHVISAKKLQFVYVGPTFLVKSWGERKKTGTSSLEPTN